MLRFTTEVKSKLGKMSRELEGLLGQVVRKTAFDIEAEAKVRAPIDTGALRASIHAVTDRESHHAQARAATAAAAPSLSLFPEVKPNERLSAVVAVGVEYGLYVEMGTAAMPGRAYLRPAMEKARRPFEQALAAAVKKAAGE